MHESPRDFHARHARPVVDWASALADHSRFAMRSGERLQACQPGAHPLLLKAIAKLRGESSEARRNIAVWAAYIQTSARYAYDEIISAQERAAWEAARDIEVAANRILRAMDGDFGGLHFGPERADEE